MEHKIRGKDNFLLVEFESIVDTDYGIYKYIRENYYNSEYFLKEPLRLRTDIEVLQMLLSRQNVNPLSVLSDENMSTLYIEMMEDKGVKQCILENSRLYDTYGLMITLLREASSLDLEVLCSDELENEYLQKLNCPFRTITMPRDALNMDNYSVIYPKYLAYLLLYPQPVEGKHIYVPMAKYNMQSNAPVINLELGIVLAQSNLIHVYDPYKCVSYRFSPEEDSIDVESTELQDQE